MALTPAQIMVEHATELINDMGAFSPDEAAEFPYDIHCLKLWLKAKLYDYGAPILKSEEMQAAVALAIEVAYRLGRSNPYERLKSRGDRIE